MEVKFTMACWEYCLSTNLQDLTEEFLEDPLINFYSLF